MIEAQVVHREAGAEVPGASNCCTALRLAAGTGSLVAGGWVLRALNDAPASLGAGPGAIRTVADGSPNYRDGVFHNLEPYRRSSSTPRRTGG